MINTPYIGLFYGAIGILLFRFRNPNRDFINVISVFTGLLFISELLFFKVNETSGEIVWIVAGGGLITSYFLRFKRKESKQRIDYVKLSSIGLLVCYPFNFFTENFFLREWYMMLPFSYLIVPVVGTIYVYDRFILKPEQMKKKFIVILVAQTILIFICMIYALVQQTDAVKAQREAYMNNEKMTQLQLELEVCRKK